MEKRLDDFDALSRKFIANVRILNHPVDPILERRLIALEGELDKLIRPRVKIQTSKSLELAVAHAGPDAPPPPQKLIRPGPVKSKQKKHFALRTSFSRILAKLTTRASATTEIVR